MYYSGIAEYNEELICMRPKCIEMSKLRDIKN